MKCLLFASDGAFFVRAVAGLSLLLLGAPLGAVWAPVSYSLPPPAYTSCPALIYRKSGWPGVGDAHSAALLRRGRS